MGGFLSRVADVGLSDALREIGLGHLVGRSASELAAGLLDALAGPASTIDDAAVRSAVSELKDELLREALTPEDVERALTTSLDDLGLSSILMRFFGLYIYERFCRDFYERWVKAVGTAAVGSSLKRIKAYINSALGSKLAMRNVASVDWRGDEGAHVIVQVLADTCAVFGVPA